MEEGQLPVPLKLIHINRCPVVAPLNVLRSEDQQRLGLDMKNFQTHAQRLTDTQDSWKDKVQALYGSEDFAPCEDPEQQLYDGFLGDRDRRLCEQVRIAEPGQLAGAQWMFDDARLPELLFRYRARNFADTLNAQEQQRWSEFCKQRLTNAAMGAPNTLESFNQALQASWADAGVEQRVLLQHWQAYAQRLGARLGL
ncbi:Exodeoxyribonuclease I [compost metagenome]